eukprot:768624-Hanusia_phi.AAC.3
MAWYLVNQGRTIVDLSSRRMFGSSRIGAKGAAVVQLVVRALKFDVRRGSASVGANVRDAASFVCWAFARAYDPSDMLPHVPEEGIIDYAVEFQLRHWDKNIRLLSGKVYLHFIRRLNPIVASLLRSLGEVCAPRLIANVLPSLIELCMSPDVPTRHGAACGIAELLHGIDLEKDAIPNETMAIEKARLFRGRGGEMMRSACSKVLEALGQNDQGLTSKLVSHRVLIASYFDSLTENLKHPTGDGAFTPLYRYVGMLEDDNPAARRGFALALGALGKEGSSVLGGQLRTSFDGAGKRRYGPCFHFVCEELTES